MTFHSSVQTRLQNREAVRRYRARHPVRVRDARRANQSTPEYLAKRHIYNVAYNIEKKELKRRLYNAWQKRHPGYATLESNRRRARIFGAGGRHTLAEWRALCEGQSNRCFYCGRSAKLTRDHWIPLISGGPDSIDNIVGACASCNSKKKRRSAAEFIRLLIEEAA